jgi:hypothetical protein
MGPSAIYRHGENSTYQKLMNQSAPHAGHISREENGKKVKRPSGPEANNSPGGRKITALLIPG